MAKRLARGLPPAGPENIFSYWVKDVHPAVDFQVNAVKVMRRKGKEPANQRIGFSTSKDRVPRIDRWRSDSTKAAAPQAD